MNKFKIAKAWNYDEENDPYGDGIQVWDVIGVGVGDDWHYATFATFREASMRVTQQATGYGS